MRRGPRVPGWTYHTPLGPQGYPRVPAVPQGPQASRGRWGTPGDPRTPPWDSRGPGGKNEFLMVPEVNRFLDSLGSPGAPWVPLASSWGPLGFTIPLKPKEKSIIVDIFKTTSDFLTSKGLKTKEVNITISTKK